MRHRVTVPILILSALVLAGCAAHTPPAQPDRSVKLAKAAALVDTGVIALREAQLVEDVIHAASPTPKDAAISAALAKAIAVGTAASATLHAAASDAEITKAVHDLIEGINAVAAAIGAPAATQENLAKFVTAAHGVLDAVVPLL